MNKLLLVICFFCIPSVQAQKRLNPDSAKDNLDAYIKIRASLDAKEQPVFYASGSIYAFEPEKPWKHLFNFEMYNIARIEKMPGDSGYYLLSREMLLYKDPATNEILKEWMNPWTSEKVEVIPVLNDPVNQRFYYNRFICPYKAAGNGRINFYNDITLTYPSPLKKSEWPDNSRSDVYQGAELFNFFCDEKQLLNPKTKNVSADISWTRFSDFLPWMRMGAKPGYLLYQSRGYKLKNFEALPQQIKDFVKNNKPEYATAPEKFTSPNMTSWKYFKQLMEERKKKSSQ
jgi:hypothetical protein